MHISFLKKKNEKKNCGNCGNAIAENGRKKKIVCGNGIAEIGGINFWQLWQWHCQKWKKKKKGYKICERVKKKNCHIHNIFTTFSQ